MGAYEEALVILRSDDDDRVSRGFDALAERYGWTEAAQAWSEAGQAIDLRAEAAETIDHRERADRAEARVRELERVLRMVRADRPSAHSDDVWAAINAALSS
jgi:hypothetical protein